jgi:hypothetical protein
MFNIIFFLEKINKCFISLDQFLNLIKYIYINFWNIRIIVEFLIFLVYYFINFSISKYILIQLKTS